MVQDMKDTVLSSIYWSSVVTSVVMTLGVSAFVLAQHSAFPHSGAVRLVEFNLMSEKIDLLRQELAVFQSDQRRLERLLLGESSYSNSHRKLFPPSD